ncbi:KUP/HAK/KT family potassium transporter [Ekhidna sp.]|uniref:KUP/HAK/KT family potassium transporter n=1 Tax=Ekhidna sp. TaxID=2608089 RepID=UPI0032ECB138
MSSKLDHSKLTPAGVLITMGIIFGDIGTSPLYVIKAIVGEKEISELLVYGGVSCVFWTLTIITTIKYVILALNADNKGEGGIFALYARLRKYKSKWIIYPAIIGCATLISDGFITPPISISSAVEGLQLINPDIQTVPIVLVILLSLFIAQQFGTAKIGSAFGPIMLVWFGMMAFFGVMEISKHPEILAAINPLYAIQLITNYPEGIWLLGAVFLCTTGAEALYSDLGHCGKANIRFSWGFVKTALLLSYFGQSAYVMQFQGKLLPDVSPFYALMPDWFLPAGIIIATGATIIASQALITGTFTMVNEAMKLRLWPRLKVEFPSQLKGQIYIPAINWLLLAGCTIVVLIFRQSSNMEAAYGLAITVDMLMTTTLLSFLIFTRFKSWLPVIFFALVFYTIEGTFFLSNANKFTHGGWFAFLIAISLFLIMYALHKAGKIRKKHVEFEKVENYLPIISKLKDDKTIPLKSTHLVYLSRSSRQDLVETNIIHSMIRSTPKRAGVYWFLHVDILDEPFGLYYEVNALSEGCHYVKLKLGFKEPHKINLMFRQVVSEMMEKKSVTDKNIHPSLSGFDIPADFKFIITNSRLTVDTFLHPFDQFFIRIYRILKLWSVSITEDFGLEEADVEVETVPITIHAKEKLKLQPWTPSQKS